MVNFQKSTKLFDNLSIREVNNKDIYFVYYLNNESSVRKNSYNSEYIKLSDHKKWFKDQLIKNGDYFFILEHSDKPIGQVRFEMQKDHSVIGISISKNFRGKGFAIKGLNLSLENYFRHNSNPVYAYIKRSNTASVRLFEKAGFHYYKDVVLNNIDSFVYKKEKHED